jgi:hypothetical protein
MGADSSTASRSIIFWECPKELKQGLRIASLLNAGLNAYWRVEGTLPGSPEEFLSSPYLLVGRAVLKNPYEGRATVVLDLTHDQKADLLQKPDEAQKLLGAIALVRGKTKKAEPSAQFVVFVQGFWWSPSAVMPHPGISLGGAPDAGSLREEYERDKKEGWFENLPERDKTVYAACHYLNNSIGVVTTLERIAGGWPRLADRARYDAFVRNLKNPFTGGMMTEVRLPSPGNYMEYEGPPFGMQALCFGQDGRIVKPLRAFYNRVAESERLRVSLGMQPSDLSLPPGL